MTKNPFASSSSRAGHGRIKVAMLPPATPVLEEMAYQYPLKLIAPAPITISQTEVLDSAEKGSEMQKTQPHIHRHKQQSQILVHTVFILTFGGGLVGGDEVDLHASLAESTRLSLLTQGSTKIFDSPKPDICTRQNLTVDLHYGASLCYLPDPVQPFADSVFEQCQIYNLMSPAANLCVCDWVSEGRTARGEKWLFHSYISRNEVWANPSSLQAGKRRLMLRDNVILDQHEIGAESVLSRMDDIGVFGTLIIYGDLFRSLGDFFMEEFMAMPRIGARQWDPPEQAAQLSSREIMRAHRLQAEKQDGLLWTSAVTRGFVVVKFGARQIEGARRWLGTMLRFEGSVESHFGERALLCVR